VLRSFFCVSLIILLIAPAVDHAASRMPLAARHGMVVTVHELASRTGTEILQKGGNAIDAAVAVALVLAVVWPEAGNLGGGGFMLIRKSDGTEEAIDYRERAPLAATRNMYLDSKGNVIEDLSTIGHKAVGVPGTIAGFGLAWKRHGKLTWRELVEPAKNFAEQGFILTPMNVKRIKTYQKTISTNVESKRIFLRNGKMYEPGERLIQPELAETLKRIQQHGPREFYEGRTAELIIADMKQNGGLVTSKDLKEYEPTIRKPIHGMYRGCEIVTMPPPSSGGIALIEMLNMLEPIPLGEFGFQSADHIHVLVEAMKRAFADRASLLGDADFVKVPVEQLISREYSSKQRINLQKAVPSADIQPAKPEFRESPSTTHFSIVDSEGNIVSNTYTLDDFFGSGVTVPKAGFLLNDEMDDFTSKPGATNLYGLLQSENNAIQPRKRPLSSMTPVIVFKDKKPYLVLGGAGGPVIITSVLQIIINVIDFHMDIQQAIDAPRIHHQWMPDEIYSESFGLNQDSRAILESRGQKFAKESFFRGTDQLGDIQGILIDPESGTFLGASDPRRGGTPSGH
jgi:gamma-glutamyltranspeptidase/glutathione hydrolase